MMPTISRRAAVVAALAQAPGHWVSGETLAAELGITRVAVGKHVSALRALGYRIEAAPHSGYRLHAAPDACIPEEVSWRLAHSLWAECRGGQSVTSTNDAAKQLARAGAAEGTLVVAAHQSAGRGRFGRAWRSPVGGMYASFVLRPPLAPAAVPPLSLAVAVGASRALDALAVPVRLKWPNDLLADGRKLGGVLLEMAAEADRVEWVVVGIGINAHDPGEPGSAWLGEFAPEPVAHVTARVLDSIAGACEEYVRFGFAQLRAEYESRLATTGEEVEVRDAAGSLIARGRVAGLDDSGALLVDEAGKISAVSAGEVTLRR